MRWRHYIVVTAVLFSFPSLPVAQELSDQTVKAAYLYNFAKFVEWPAPAFSNASAPIRLCLLSGDPLELDLKKIVQGKSVTTHPVGVIPVRTEEEFRTCHVLFVGSVQDRQAKQILQSVRGASVLTVGDGKDFAQNGGIIQFVVNKDRVQFVVNYKAAGEAQLSVSSRLLRVATAVIQ